MDDSLLPIDIHYNKLQDWLQNRRHCIATWQQSAIDIRQRINVAIQDMPPVDEITQLLKGTYINYFHCLQIVELLKQTEDGAKNIFGRYSSQRLKDWLEIIKLYEKDGIYLAEAAQMLGRSVNYEIPALKRQIAKCLQLQQEYARKEVEYGKASDEFHEKFKVACKRMGIEGKSIKKELFELVKCLPQTFEEIARESRKLSPVVSYYTRFISFILDKVDADKDCLNLLRHVIERGNTTVFEWQTGRPPLKVIETPFVLDTLDEDESQEKEEKIDWGNLDLSTSITEGASDDPGIVLEEDAIDNEIIDWEVIDPLASGIEIEVVNSDSSPEAEAAQVSADATASGVDALSLLDNIATRSIFVDELSELETFLRQRLVELSMSGAGALSGTILQSAPESLNLDREKVAAMLEEVSALLDRLMTQKMVDLLLIRSFPRYVDRLVDDLKRLTSESEKMRSMSRLMVLKREETLSEQHDLEPKLEVMRQKMKELQRQIETDISTKYKNRRVNVMGEINTI